MITSAALASHARVVGSGATSNDSLSNVVAGGINAKAIDSRSNSNRSRAATRHLIGAESRVILSLGAESFFATKQYATSEW